MSILTIIGGEIACTAGFAAIKFVAGKIARKSTKNPLETPPPEYFGKLVKEHAAKGQRALNCPPMPAVKQPKREKHSRQSDFYGSLSKIEIDHINVAMGGPDWEIFRNPYEQTTTIASMHNDSRMTVCDDGYIGAVAKVTGFGEEVAALMGDFGEEVDAIQTHAGKSITEFTKAEVKRVTAVCNGKAELKSKTPSAVLTTTGVADVESIQAAWAAIHKARLPESPTPPPSRNFYY